MINQIEPSLKIRSRLRGIAQGLNQARRIQARLKGLKGDVRPATGFLLSPLTGVSTQVQISRWIE
jgi:hypothetical protein